VRVTDSQSEAMKEGTQDNPLAEYAASLAEAVGASDWTAEHGTVRLLVDRSNWVAAVEAAVGTGLRFFSFLSAIDWANEVEVGEGIAGDSVDERYELFCRLSSTENADAVHIVSSVPKDDASIATLTAVFSGAAWHEREAAEMFGIDFVGNTNLKKLYLPDAFEGHPLRKSFPLLTREIKPWPGTVDVEDKPSTENVEADAGAGE
jgi:NADH-quinone oxidoreductase subunit C